MYNQITEALVRIANGHALAAGLPEEMMPVITFPEDFTPPVENDANFGWHGRGINGECTWKENVIRVDPATVAEDFGKYGRTDEKVKLPSSGWAVSTGEV